MKKPLSVFLFAIFASSFAWASLLYVPPGFEPDTARMVVAIHGCLQSAESMALGSGWNNLAEQKNLVVLYPQVPPHTHAQDCWRYWLPENQRPGSGELAMIHDEVQHWKNELGMHEAPVFLTGLSSGAAMAASLMACYPEDFAAGALHSGLSYGLAKSEGEALKVQLNGPGRPVEDRPCDPRRFKGGVMVIQGTRDRTVHPSHAERVIRDFIGPAQRVTTTHKENDRTYTITNYRVGDELRGRLVMIRGTAHAWSGFNLDLRRPETQQPWSLGGMLLRFLNFGEYSTVKVPFFSNKGPSATHLAYEFFEASEPPESAAIF